MNKQLLEHYIEAYGTDIYSFCIRLTQNRELAEELYQDTFLAMCEKEDWKEEGNVKSYLLGITIKLWQNRKRKFAWRKLNRSGDSLIEGAGTGSIFGR